MLNSDFRDIVSAFCAAKVEFMLVGAYAVAAHGLPRATGYIDLWVECSQDNAERIWSALSQFGAPLESLSKQDFLNQDTVVQLGVAPRRIDILTQLTGVDYSEAKPDRIVIDLEGITVPVIGLTHLLQNKAADLRTKRMLPV